MPKDFKITIIIPTCNEKEIINDSIARISNKLKSLNINAEIVVVDDSRDGTEKILKKLSRKINSLRIIHREDSRGVGSAVRMGIKNASSKYAVIFMSDAPDDIKYVPSIIKKLRQGYDLVNTSRFMKGSKIIGYPLTKTIANKICNYGVRLAFLRLDLKDFSSLFKGFNVERIKKLKLDANEFDIGLDIALKAIRKRYKIVEVPVDWKERKAGKSKLRLSKQGPQFIKRVVKIFLFYW